jgi:hypothetical protein
LAAIRVAARRLSARGRIERRAARAGQKLPPLLQTARTKIEFSSLNANLMVPVGGHPILSW